MYFYKFYIYTSWRGSGTQVIVSPEQSGGRAQLLHILFGSRWLPASPSDKDNTADSFPGDSMEDVYWIIWGSKEHKLSDTKLQ